MSKDHLRLSTGFPVSEYFYHSVSENTWALSVAITQMAPLLQLHSHERVVHLPGRRLVMTWRDFHTGHHWQQLDPWIQLLDTFVWRLLPHSLPLRVCLLPRLVANSIAIFFSSFS